MPTAKSSNASNASKPRKTAAPAPRPLFSSLLSKHRTLVLSLLALGAGAGLGRCSEALPDGAQQATRYVQAVLASESLHQSVRRALAPWLGSSESPAPAARPPAQADPAALADAPEPFSACRQFFAAGRSPLVTLRPSYRALCYDAFAVLHNGETKTPVFVAERLNRALVADADEKRTNRFFPDARLPSSERATLDDYKGSGYARGHLAPAGDMPTAQAMAQSFSLANMVPQVPQHNSGPWARVEKDVRQYASRAQGDVYILTGPVFAPDSPRIGPNQVRVPKVLFKLVYDARTQTAWAYWHENREGPQSAQPITYEELARRTGLNLLPAVTPKPLRAAGAGA